MNNQEIQREFGFPMNINRYLAIQKYASRRGAEELVAKGKVRINGRLAVIGDRVFEADDVEVNINAISKKYVYFAYNKPRGVITHSPQGDEVDIKMDLQKKAKGKNALPNDIFPIGRLDKDSEGLIILTNDGRITDRLLNPKFSHEKEYVVETKLKLRNNFKDKMEAGVQIDLEKTGPCKIKILGESKFSIILTEGKKHQIRRMCVALFNEVKSLKRVRIMNIELFNLAPGQTRPIEGNELATFLKSIEM